MTIFTHVRDASADIVKGFYIDTPQNRKLGRVGQGYDGDTSEKKDKKEVKDKKVSTFTLDPNHGLGKDWEMFKLAAKKVPISAITFSQKKIMGKKWFKNLTSDEIRELAALVNVKFHSGFSMMDLRLYYRNLSESREK